MRKLFIPIFIILLYSCSDVLDKFPLSQPSQDTFWTSANEIERGINGCYSFLQETNAPDWVFPIVLDCMSDVGFIRMDNDYKTLGKGEHDQRNNVIATTWSRCYQGIGRCNNMLQIIDNSGNILTDKEKSQYRGEALFLRAYYYTRLVTYWGDVPLVLIPLVSINEGMNVERTTKEKVIDQIMSDYTESSNLLVSKYTEKKDIGRATKWTAESYKARAALIFNKWQVAADAAKSVIESKQYQLYPKYGDLFLPEGLFDETNKEIILQREYSGLIPDYHYLPRNMLSRNVGAWATLVPSQSMIDSYHCIDGKNINDSPLFDKSKPFENRDPRLKLTYVVPGERFGDYQFESHFDSITCYNYATKKRVKNNDCYSLNQYTAYTGYYPRKYNSMDYKDLKTKGDYPVILYRYAEVLLNYAEAKIELNQIDNTVVDVINKIRNDREDVKMPLYTLSDFNNQDFARNILRHERKIELSFEGFRYTDLRRWGLANDYLNTPILGRPFKGSFMDWPIVKFDRNGEPFYPNYEDYISHPSEDYRVVESRQFTKERDELWPVPEKEINLNSKLTQNPGY